MELKDLKFMSKEKRLSFAYLCAVVMNIDNDSSLEEQKIVTSIATILELNLSDIEDAMKHTFDTVKPILRKMTESEINLLGVCLSLVAKADGIIDKRERDAIAGILLSAGLTRFQVFLLMNQLDVN